MKAPDASEIRELTEKLKTQDDISLEEADWIFTLFSANSLKTQLNSNSSKARWPLMSALKGWYNVVAEKIKQGQRGNFVFTVITSNKLPVAKFGFNHFMHTAQEYVEINLKQNGTFEELFSKLMIDGKTYSFLPKELQKFFTSEKTLSLFVNFYVLKSPRVDMYHYPIKTEKGTYTIAQFFDGLSPIMKTHSYDAGSTFFEIASGAREILSNSWYLERTRGSMTAQCVIAAYMYYKKAPCVTMVGYDPKDPPGSGECFAFFTEKDKAQIIKDAMEIPFEDIVKNAFDQNVINKQTAKELLNNAIVWKFPAAKFIETSIKYIDHVLQKQKEWKATRKEIEDEDEWLVETR